MSRTIKRNNKNSFAKVSKYLPVFIILLSLTIILGSTFAYFTDKVERSSDLTFSKVELSSETTTGINGTIKDVIPGTPLVDGALKFSKSIDSEPIYVRAKISFSLPSEYKDDEDMNEMLDLLRSATDFNIEESEQHGAVWSAKDGNYFYLMEAVADGTPTNLMRVDTIDTYILSNEVVVPRDLTSLPDNAQYMKSINFHVAYEAIQADNVSSVLSETKQTFNAIFPENDDEKNTIKVTFKGFDGVSNLKVEKVEKGYILNEPVVDIPVDANNEPMYVIDGWYTDSEFANEYEFGNVVEDTITLYPLVYEVSQGLKFTEIKENGVVVAYSVAKGTCEDTEIVVPSTYMGKPVTQVASNAFHSMKNLLNIYLPTSIEIIKGSAFSGCTSLALTELPTGIISIGSSAFRECANLALTSLPSGVTSIDSWAFYNCTKLSLTELPVGVASICEYVFYNCANLALTSLPSEVKSVDSWAFYKCASLALTSLPAGVISIGEHAFRDCTNLTLTSLPAGMTYISFYAFSGCTNLALTELPVGVTSIEVCTFSRCSSLALTSLPAGVTSIASYAFEGCTNLALTSLPDGLISIGDYSFFNCVNLALTELPSDLINIGNDAFYNCEKLALTSLPAGVTSINEYTFKGCVNLTLMSLYDSVTSISRVAFYECRNLALVSLPASLTNMGSAFRECPKLNYILCETSEVATLVQGKGRSDSCIYTLQDVGYESGTQETEVVISDDVTIYTTTIDGYKWVRTSDNKYYKCIVTG